MRYTRQEKTVATICDTLIPDAESIRDLLVKLKELKIKFSLSYNHQFPNSYMQKLMTYDEVKVKKTYEDKADFIIFKLNTVINITIQYDDIDKILAITEKRIMIKNNPDINRFGLMDLGEE
ncbi:MAG: hypothetical protein J7L15_05880 [Clostridiales bacterium]|nr:hypothetical protein [Clostridiales bacterium]